MSATVTDDELAAIRTSTRAHLDELLEEPGIASNVVALERIGAALLAAYVQRSDEPSSDVIGRAPDRVSQGRTKPHTDERHRGLEAGNKSETRSGS